MKKKEALAIACRGFFRTMRIVFLGGSTLLQHSSFLLVVHADVVGVEDGVVHLVAHAVGGVELVAAGTGHRGCGGGTRPAVTDKFVAAAAFAVARGQAEKAQGG